MAESSLEMRFDPQTIKHLGLRMYSTLPPALAEIVSNSYDADAENVVITLSKRDGSPEKIKIEDDKLKKSRASALLPVKTEENLTQKI